MNIGSDVIAALSRAMTNGNTLTLGDQLERKLYGRVDKVLAAAGGKWNRGAKAHVFPCDALDAIDPILLTGTVATPQEFGFFETPNNLADRLAELANLGYGHKILEPSAGGGNLLAAIGRRRVDCKAHAVEIQPGLVDKLRTRFMCNVCVHAGDFLTFAPPAERFDRVVMNPPFTRGADVKHVAYALDFLKPGGKLVAIMSAGITFREDKAAAALRTLLDGAFEQNPPGSFKAAGTNVNTVIVTATKR